MNNFNRLVSTIQQLHIQLQHSAVNAVNQMLTIRNWLIGYYIVEFEQNGEDRAKYGDRLVETIAEKLEHIKGIDKRSLFRFRQFYLYYPQIVEAIHVFLPPILEQTEKVGTLFPQLPDFQKVGTLSPILQKAGTLSQTSNKEEMLVPGEKIIRKLSYSHIELLLGIDEPLKRAFYELECIKGNWSVRELKRQINSLYFERSGLSKNPEKLAKLVQQKTKPQAGADIVKNIYAFEFLDLSVKEIVEESDFKMPCFNRLEIR